MEIITLEEDIHVFCVTASSFPEGIMDAFDKLNKELPFNPDRRIFGLSRPENGGDIVYRAAGEVLPSDTADKMEDTLYIKKGRYTSTWVEDFRNDPRKIGQAFDALLKHEQPDPKGYCVEWYAPGMRSVKCMVRLVD